MAERIAWVGLSATLLKSYVCCSYLAEINWFLYNFAVSRRAANLLLLMMVASLRPAIGSTLGASFQLSWVLGYPPQLGSASRALGLRQQTETKAIVGDEWYLLLWTRVWPRRLSFTSWHGLQITEGSSTKKWTHYDEMTNDTWAILNQIQLRNT